MNKLQRCYFMFWMSLIFLTFFSVNNYAQLFSIKTHIPSEAAGEEGVAVKIIPPPMSRFPEGAPVVVYVEGGIGGEGISGNGVNLELRGFIELLFNFPGSGIAEDLSGGTYDLRGPLCLKALRDVIRFALGELADNDGKFLDQLVQPINPLPGNVGLIGLSNGGNATIAAVGVHGTEISSLAWIVNFESPVGDGMPDLEAGSKGSSWNPTVNPAYDPDTGEFDLSLVAYDNMVSINNNPAFRSLGEFHGGLYFDINQNNAVDVGTDFIVSPFFYLIEDTVKAFYSVRLMQEASDRSLLPDNSPAHITSLQQTEEFWRWRDGENWFEEAVKNIPNLMFIVEASETDHAQSAPDHPHVLIQYEGFRSTGARFVRLNPDQAYVEYILGRSAPDAADNDAFTVFDHQTIRTALEPPRHGGYSIDITVAAAACELADRTKYGILEPQIDKIITTVKQSKIQPTNFKLFQNYPNPFNASTVIRFSLPYSSTVILKILDIQGKEVTTLINDELETGPHQIEFDVKNLPSGMYFYQIKTDRFSQSRKFMMLK